tara:strand:+ start:2077 stop:2265 length:189 start_codon:yes stop_codon:yes gene_type:complete
LLFESPEDDFDSALVFVPESELDLESDFFSDLESDFDSDPFSEDPESESLPDAPFEARLSVT